MFREVPCIRVEDEAFAGGEHAVVEEIAFTVTVNGRQALTAMTGPAMLREFVTGFLFTEGIVRGLDEIESMTIEEHAASVLTTNPFAILVSKKTVLSGCGGTTSFLDGARLPTVSSDLEVTPAMLRAAVRDALTSDLHARTGGVHIVGLYDREGRACLAEDIGRHNAMDRVIGYGLLHKIDFSRTFVVCSGRISSEMVRKCLVAGVPVVVSRGATTTLALRIAEEGGVTVVGFARGRKMNIYTRPERVAGAPSLARE
ncbi:formate dehydrogenase accessory sulfurtransferase FdhD [Methanofollis aquaemaris]|uniref:Sulfur carrier protein FdhD n=1 Tax=Methanofollis aquaemaris TaxID=126734 RepID=A0A8A3S3E5_9EURY|nr:formate dehydrogenase accessory sulfurtransferase FdhD [Methanofollis aquaemaris]QSZ66180.1 formate dehydrogenase accessory sulfurtransferase FdhD [Methanofollis aquaemaris]